MKKGALLYNIGSLNRVLEEQNCIIYGAGKVARTVLKYAGKNNYKIEKIIVSNDKSNPTDILGVSVIEKSNYIDVCKKDNLIVCVMENLHNEIEKEIQGIKFDNIYYVSDNLFLELNFENGDFEIECLYEIFKVQRELRARDKTIYWTNNYERRIVKENWGNVTESIDFKEKFLNLIRGLDAESIDTVIRILNRQRIYLSSNSNKLDIYTQDEQKQMRELQENFRKCILKVSEDLYAYKNYLLPSNEFSESVFYYKHGIKELHDRKKIEGKAIIDVGGFIGDSVLVLEELLPQKIYTFEAVPENYNNLLKTLQLNHLENVISENCALGKERGDIQISVAGSSSSSNRKGVNFKDVITVPVTTLDEYVEEHNIEDVGLIKVDIEGAEPDFLQGARKTITKYKPVILLSIYHNAHDFFELKPLLEDWDLGYKFKIYKPVNGNITNETLLIAEVC